MLLHEAIDPNLKRRSLLQRVDQETAWSRQAITDAAPRIRIRTPRLHPALSPYPDDIRDAVTTTIYRDVPEREMRRVLQDAGESLES